MLLPVFNLLTKVSMMCATGLAIQKPTLLLHSSVKGSSDSGSATVLCCAFFHSTCTVCHADCFRLSANSPPLVRPIPNSKKVTSSTILFKIFRRSIGMAVSALATAHAARVSSLSPIIGTASLIPAVAGPGVCGEAPMLSSRTQFIRLLALVQSVDVAAMLRWLSSSVALHTTFVSLLPATDVKPSLLLTVWDRHWMCFRC